MKKFEEKIEVRIVVREPGKTEWSEAIHADSVADVPRVIKLASDKYVQEKKDEAKRAA